MTRPVSLLDRFPHLQRDICFEAKKDKGFRQLCDDYELLVRSLRTTNFQAPGDLEEMISLKTSLEVEVLERLSQTRIG
jgi:hypothetical protein